MTDEQPSTADGATFVLVHGAWHGAATWDDVVPELLELSQLLERDAVAEVDIGRGRVDAELDAQRTVFLEFGEEVFLVDNLGGASLE